MDDLGRERLRRRGLLGDADRLADVVAHLCEQRAPGARLRACRVMVLVKWLAMSEPNTATPTAPPIWRVVSFTAEPTPALARGSEPMIESVHGARTFAMPEAHQHGDADDEDGHAARRFERAEQQRATWSRGAGRW